VLSIASRSSASTPLHGAKALVIPANYIAYDNEKADEPAMSAKRISLVLGSGGARGLAHIGAIRCLDAHGFEITYISGCSIGALIGGIYAAGELDAYENWVRALQRRDVARLLDWSFSKGAMFSGDRIIGVLEEVVGTHTIEDLDIGFTAVATDIHDQREVWLNRGSLFAAIRASIAMPLIFAPVDRGSQVLVDGGLVNPVPIAPTLNNESTMTIAVDLNGRAERLDGSQDDDDSDDEKTNTFREKISAFVDELMPKSPSEEIEPPSAIELALSSIDTMQATISRMKLAAYSPRLTVSVPRNLCTFLEFHRAPELIEFGYQRTELALSESDLL
jgi:NTE family protein